MRPHACGTNHQTKVSAIPLDRTDKKLGSLAQGRSGPVGAARRVVQDTVEDEGSKHCLTHRRLQPQQAGRLFDGQRQTRHFLVLGAHTSDKTLE